MHCQETLKFHDLIFNPELSESKFQVTNDTMFVLGKATYTILSVSKPFIIGHVYLILNL